MSRFDPQTLKLFLAAVEGGSIAAAGERLNIAPSAVSRRFKELEADAGAVLLIRGRRGVSPTPAGLALAEHARSMMRLMDRMESDLDGFAEGMRGTVRMAANVSAVSLFLPEALADFLKAFPDVSINVTEAVSTRIVQEVEDGVIDIGVFSDAVDPGGLEVSVLLEDRVMVAVRRDHPLASRSAIKLSDLVGEPLIGLEQGSSLQNQILRAAHAQEMEASFRVQVVSFDGVRRMAAAGLGSAILPEGAIRPFMEPLGLAAIPLEEDWAARRLVAGVRDAGLLSKAAARLLLHLAEWDEGCTA